MAMSNITNALYRIDIATVHFLSWPVTHGAVNCHPRLLADSEARGVAWPPVSRHLGSEVAFPGREPGRHGPGGVPPRAQRPGA